MLLLICCSYVFITCIPFGNIGEETKRDDTTCIAFRADVNLPQSPPVLSFLGLDIVSMFSAATCCSATLLVEIA